MFDIGFSELVIISLIALIVIGPQRLPRVARTLGALAGRLQRYVADVKADISREVEMEELKKMRQSVEQTATSFEQSVSTELNKAESELNAAASAAGSTPLAPHDVQPAGVLLDRAQNEIDGGAGKQKDEPAPVEEHDLAVEDRAENVHEGKHEHHREQR